MSRAGRLDRDTESLEAPSDIMANGKRRPKRRRPSKLRRELVAGAVRENVDSLSGQWFRRHRRRREEDSHRAVAQRGVAWQRISVWALLVLGAALAAGASWFSWKTLREMPETVVEVPLTVPTDSVGDQAIEYRTPDAADRALFRLGVRTIVIDAGHGGENDGTVGESGLVEKEITLDIAEKLEGMLEAAAYRVLMTREDDSTISLDERAGMANRLSGDLFISIHVNWLVNRKARGVETYYLGPTDDPFLKELTFRENSHSGYTLAHFRSMLERVYADARGADSRLLAESVQAELYDALSRVNPDLIDRGVKTAPFVVLTGTEMPAILAEVSCLSNRQEETLLQEDAYREYIAEALFRGIHSYARGLNESNDLERGS